MILLVWLMVGALATFRLASLLAHERGPFGLMVRLRTLVGVDHDALGAPRWLDAGDVALNPITNTRLDDVLHEVARGLTCLWCCSLWVSALVTTPLVGLVTPVLVSGWPHYLLTALALSSAAILADSLVSRA